jgi:purine-binding chemotaxis protein CheW
MNNDILRNHDNSADEAKSSGVVRTIQLLRAGTSQFGIFANEIAAIEAWREPTSLPQAPKSVLGVVSIQGRMLTVLDLANLPGREGSSTDATAQHLIALRGDEQLALAVDALGETVEVADGDLDIEPRTGETFVLGILHREGTDIYILDSKELFPTAIQGRERRRRRF